MKNNYPTFPNPAGIGSCLGYENGTQAMGMPNSLNPMDGRFIPAQPHEQIRLTPGPGSPDPVQGSHTMYNPYLVQDFNPWGDLNRDGR